MVTAPDVTTDRLSVRDKRSDHQGVSLSAYTEIGQKIIAKTDGDSDTAETRQGSPRKRSVLLVREHFAAVLNAVSAAG
jgi:hypothetical protein